MNCLCLNCDCSLHEKKQPRKILLNAKIHLDTSAPSRRQEASKSCLIQETVLTMANHSMNEIKRHIAILKFSSSQSYLTNFSSSKTAKKIQRITDSKCITKTTLKGRKISVNVCSRLHYLKTARRGFFMDLRLYFKSFCLSFAFLLVTIWHFMRQY